MKKLVCALLAALLLLVALVSCKKSGDVDVPYGMQLASDPSVVDYYLFVPSKWTVEMATGATGAYYSTDDPSSITVSAYGLSKDVSDAESYWAFFKKQFLKRYDSVEEEIRRYKIFQDNMQTAAHYNDVDKEASYGMTKFSDKLPSELFTALTVPANRKADGPVSSMPQQV